MVLKHLRRGVFGPVPAAHTDKNSGARHGVRFAVDGAGPCDTVPLPFTNSAWWICRSVLTTSGMW